MSRQPSLNARLAQQLERVTFALEVLAVPLSDHKSEPSRLSDREALAPSVAVMVDDSRNLLDQYRARQGKGGRS